VDITRNWSGAATTGGPDEGRLVFDNDENAFLNLSANVTGVDRVWAGGAGTIAYIRDIGVSELWELYSLRLSAAVYRQPVTSQLGYTPDHFAPRPPIKMQEEDSMTLFSDDYPLIG
jgi:hypothetical protein